MAAVMSHFGARGATQPGSRFDCFYSIGKCRLNNSLVENIGELTGLN